jgi:hypothetical protein
MRTTELRGAVSRDDVPLDSQPCEPVMKLLERKSNAEMKTVYFIVYQIKAMTE